MKKAELMKVLENLKAVFISSEWQNCAELAHELGENITLLKKKKEVDEEVLCAVSYTHSRIMGHLEDLRNIAESMVNQADEVEGNDFNRLGEVADEVDDESYRLYCYHRHQAEMAKYAGQSK